MEEWDPFPDNSKDCSGRVEDKNSVTLTSAIFVCQYEDWWHDSSLWAMSEHLNVLYWLVQACSANTALLWGQWWVNQGLFCMYCVVIVGKTSSFGLEVIAVNSRPAVRLHGQVENIDSSDNVSDFEKIMLCLPFKVSVTLHKVFHWKKENILLAF